MNHPAGGDDDVDVSAPGWDAIDAALTGLHGAVQPQHVGYDPPPGLSNNLQGCSAYPAGGHWHYVTYGLSELYEADEASGDGDEREPGADPLVSGWGFELTLRVPRPSPRDRIPPDWPFTMINEVARFVNGGGAALGVGGRIDLRAAVTGHPGLPDAPPSGLTVFAVTPDPALPAIDTPNGRVHFLQLVGVSAAEKERMLATSTAQVLAELAAADPLLITDPARA
ncbi:hypothetical protein ABIB25_003214 [Nakamurella sp. UYEF19]|uniref:suppressor of fused domain protein n=1 Tax=Nakamurella sp. UYEF19 TaxID=1756392 RepID=UPI0033957741